MSKHELMPSFLRLSYLLNSYIVRNLLLLDGFERTWRGPECRANCKYHHQSNLQLTTGVISGEKQA